MTVVNVHEAKTHFSSLLKRAEAGEEITIARAGKPVARLSRLSEQSSALREPGALRGQIIIDDRFSDADQEIAELFDGDSS